MFSLQFNISKEHIIDHKIELTKAQIDKACLDANGKYFKDSFQVGRIRCLFYIAFLLVYLREFG
jgi:hypothetical protein